MARRGIDTMESMRPRPGKSVADWKLFVIIEKTDLVVLDGLTKFMII